MNTGPGAPDVVAGGVFGVFCLIYIVMFAVSIAAMVFWIMQIVDVARRQFPDQNTKMVWLLVVILTGIIGALIYHFVGKPQGTLPS